MPITAEHIIANRHCSLAASKGYIPDVPGMNEKAVFMLHNFPHADEAVEQMQDYVPKIKEVTDWYLHTDFYLQRTPEADFPRKVVSDAYVRNSPYGTRLSVTYKVGSSSIDLYATFPYIHMIHGQYEAVYPTLIPERPDIPQWSDIVLRTMWNNAMFKHVTDQTLHARYLGFGSFIERRIRMQHGSLDRVIENFLMTSSAPVFSPGIHCESKDKEGEYRCPLRRSKQCNPICGVPKPLRLY